MHVKAVPYLSAISLNERIEYLKLLFRWQGSVWSLLWADFLWFLMLYIGVTLLYRLYLVNDPYQKRMFEKIVGYMNKVGSLVPLSFLLGFFVSTILGRWWQVISSIPWMTKPSFACQSLISGGKDKTVRRSIRITFLRYMNLAWILSLMHLSQKVKDRFFIYNPDTTKNFLKKKEKSMAVSVRQRLEKINADEVVMKCFGEIVTEDEICVFEALEKEYKSKTGTYKPPYIVPLMWANKLLQKALSEGFIVSEKFYLNLYGVVMDFRGGLGTLGMFNEFNVPLVYTQVVIIVVYSFLLSEIFSQQVIIGSGAPINSFNWQDCFPIFTIFKFLIYMGWFKIGLSLINPLGREKTDIPLDVVLDYNLEISTTVGPSDDFYFPEYLSDNPGTTDMERLVHLKKFDRSVKAVITDEQETSFVKTALIGHGDDKDSSKFEVA